MFPEKEIVGLWLNSKGYLVVSDINAGKNKVADALALKVEGGKLTKAVHVEVAVSVSGAIEEVSEKFNDRLIRGAISKLVKQFSGAHEYSKMLVVGAACQGPADDVEVVAFGDVLSEAMLGLDKQNYMNPTIRTLQLFKYLLACNPDCINHFLLGLKSSKAMSPGAIEKLVENLLMIPEARVVFSRQKNLELAESCLKGSAMLKPKPIADLLVKHMSTRAFNQFLKELFMHDKAKQFTKKTSPKQKSLSVFIE
jgi:hypothetical protein